MIKIPENIQELKSYKLGKALPEIIKELKLDKVAVLWNNENNFGPSPLAITKVQESLQTSNLYPDPTCLELRALLAKKWNRSVNEIAVGNGSESIFNNLFNAFFKEGEELLTSEGTFVAVYIWAKANNIKVSTVPLSTTFEFDLDALLSAINVNTKAIYLSNPNNPTGSMIDKHDLVAFIEKVPKDVLVILDEAYYEFANDISDDYPNGASLKYDNLLVLRTFSKAYGIAGIRIGYAIGAARLIESIMKVKLTFAPSNLAQAAGIGAVNDDRYLQKTIQNNSVEILRYYHLFDELKINYQKSYANFIMINLGSEKNVQYYYNELMKKGVFVRPLKAFGLPHCLRITIGIPEENSQCIKAFRGVAGAR